MTTTGPATSTARTSDPAPTPRDPDALAATAGEGWTEARVAALRDLWGEGHATAEIGWRMGISKNAVVGKAHRLNLPARPSPLPAGAAPGGAGREHPAVTRHARAPLRAPAPTGTWTLPQADRPAADAAATPPAPPPVVGPPATATPRAEPTDRERDHEAGGRGCLWPIGEPRRPGFHFCGGQTLAPGRPYCEAHHRAAHEGPVVPRAASSEVAASRPAHPGGATPRRLAAGGAGGWRWT